MSLATGSDRGIGASSAATAPLYSTSPSSCLDAYEPLDIIGSGTFGVIRRVKRLSDGKIFARKELKFERMSDRDRKQIVSEVNILRTLAHDNIVRYEERFVDRENAILYIVMEYCEGGDLGSMIRECRKTKTLLSEDTVLKYLVQMIKGLDACHHAQTNDGSPRIILHRDLKPENIFLNSEQMIKIGDFGLSKEVSAHSFACTYVGTPYYMSPELATGAQYDVKSDIWALGCVAYELCALRPPFDATTQAELTRKIQLGNVPELPRGYSRMLGDMIRGMLSLDPAARPTTHDLMRIPLIRVASRRREDQERNERRVEAALAERERLLTEREAALNLRESQLNAREIRLKQREAQLRRQSRCEAGIHPSSELSVEHKQLQTRRASAGAMADSSDISMRDASAWLMSSPLRDAINETDKENRAGAHHSQQMRARRSSPSKVAIIAAANQRAAAVAALAAASNVPSNAPPPYTTLPGGGEKPNVTTGEDSLPSPFLRRIMRTQSQPASALKTAASPNDELTLTRQTRLMSAMPRRRQSIVPPGSIGVAPLGRKSGETRVA
jgi:NIMA (never in mitosis gene a)-related kinase